MKRGANRVRWSWVLCAVGFMAEPASAWRLEDTLHGSTQGHQVGGELRGDGWHVTARTDRAWYALPRLVSGSVEFTITGLTMARVWSPYDNEIFAMYEAGYEISEPISYSQFRVNNYKCMLRIYGSGDAGRAGRQKLMWGMCPGGPPGYDACACGTSFFEEPYGGDGNWNGSAERFRIEWHEGVTRYLRNGRQVLQIDWSHSGLSFGPESLHMSLGTSRPSAVETAQLPIGIVFSDVVIEGTEGALSVCRNPLATDSGNEGVDATMSLFNTVEVPVLEDVTVAPGSPTTVYEDVNDLSVGHDDSEYYLKFRVASLPGRVVRAALLLHSSDYASAEGDGASVFAASSSTWTESTLVWNARPGPRGTRLARLDRVSADRVYTLTLPPETVPHEGVFAFAVLPEPTDTNAAHFDARERGVGRGAVLRLTVDPTMEASDAGVAMADAPEVSARDITEVFEDRSNLGDLSERSTTDVFVDATARDGGVFTERFSPSGCACSARSERERNSPSSVLIGATIVALGAAQKRRKARARAKPR